MTEWIKNDEQFGEIFLLSMTCVFIDSRREPTPLIRLAFDDIEVGAPAFAELIDKLLEWSGETSCFYVVLRPDPVQYFHRLFGKYPALEIKRGNSSAEYLASLNRGPEQSPADAIGTNYSERAIVPRSLRWFVHSFQSSDDQSGHLWVPKEWVDRIRDIYPYDLTAEKASSPGPEIVGWPESRS